MSILGPLIAKVGAMSLPAQIITGSAVLAGSVGVTGAITDHTYEVTETKQIPVSVEYIDDETMDEGPAQLVSEGTPGTIEETYRIRKVNGVEVSKVKQSEKVISDAVPTKAKRGLLVVTLGSEQEEIAFSTQRKSNLSMYKGEEKVIQEGVNGLKQKDFEKRTLRGVEKSKQYTSEAILREPAPKIIEYGTKERVVEPRCHSSYVGACLSPNASDYDCVGGSGNGPLYTGFVEVVGPDVYDLDRDGDGQGCE